MTLPSKDKTWKFTEDTKFDVSKWFECLFNLRTEIDALKRRVSVLEEHNKDKTISIDELNVMLAEMKETLSRST